MIPGLTWRQIIPISVTLAAMMSGFFSILTTVEGMSEAAPGPYHLWAAQLIMLAMILDGIDGNLARRLKGCSAIGAELDTYVDMTAFGIAPALLIYVVSLQEKAMFWRVLMTGAVVLSGVVRLARFKAMDPHRGQMGYSGLPITACAGWVAMFVFISQSGWQKNDPLWLTQGPVATVFLLGVIVFIVLQVSNVRYPKPTKMASLFIPSVLVVMLIFIPPDWLKGIPHCPWMVKLPIYAAELIMILGVGYIVLGPLYMKQAADRRKNGAPPANGLPNE